MGGAAGRRRDTWPAWRSSQQVSRWPGASPSPSNPELRAGLAAWGCLSEAPRLAVTPKDRCPGVPPPALDSPQQSAAEPLTHDP